MEKRGDREPSDATEPNEHNVKRVCANTAKRKQKLGRLLAEVGPTLSWQDKDRLRQLLLGHHQAFAVEEGDRGETDLIQMTVDTGDALSRRQPVRCTPFAVRTEVARQLQEMQSQGVIEPSSSPWASPVVLVRKNDGSLRFCIDYRHLNLVTKPDVFPLPRMDSWDSPSSFRHSTYRPSFRNCSQVWQM